MERRVVGVLGIGSDSGNDSGMLFQTSVRLN